MCDSFEDVHLVYHLYCGANRDAAGLPSHRVQHAQGHSVERQRQNRLAVPAQRYHVQSALSEAELY